MQVTSTNPTPFHFHKILTGPWCRYFDFLDSNVAFAVVSGSFHVGGESKPDRNLGFQLNSYHSIADV